MMIIMKYVQLSMFDDKLTFIYIEGWYRFLFYLPFSSDFSVGCINFNVAIQISHSIVQASI